MQKSVVFLAVDNPKRKLRRKLYLQVNYFTSNIFLLYYTVTADFVVVACLGLAFPESKPQTNTWVRVIYLGSDSRNQEGGRRESEDSPGEDGISVVRAQSTLGSVSCPGGGGVCVPGLSTQ